jgi:hypothetical protein
MQQEFITKLQQELGLQGPTGAQGDFLFAFALEDTIVTISDFAPGFQLSCNLGPIPEQKIEDFFALMLRGNLFGQATRFGTLGLDENGLNVLLNYTESRKVQYLDFRNAVEDFINVVDYWKNQIKNHPAPL